MSSESCVSTVVVLPTAGVGSASAGRSLGAASAAGVQAGLADIMLIALFVPSATGDRSPESALPDRCGPNSAVDAVLGSALLAGIPIDTHCEDVIVAGRSVDERLDVSSVGSAAEAIGSVSSDLLEGPLSPAVGLIELTDSVSTWLPCLAGVSLGGKDFGDAVLGWASVEVNSNAASKFVAGSDDFRKETIGAANTHIVRTPTKPNKVPRDP